MSILGDRLRELRGSKSQRDMAEAIGVKMNAWARYERGEVEPGAKILANICRENNVSADWLLGLSVRNSGNVATVNGSGNAVSIGTGSVILSSTNPDKATVTCNNKCPFKKVIRRLQKAGMTFSDLPKE